MGCRSCLGLKSRFYELLAEIAVSYPERLASCKPVLLTAQVAYFADVFEQLNTLNEFVQRHEILEQCNEFDAFKKKIWASHVSKD